MPCKSCVYHAGTCFILSLIGPTCRALKVVIHKTWILVNEGDRKLARKNRSNKRKGGDALLEKKVKERLAKRAGKRAEKGRVKAKAIL